MTTVDEKRDERMRNRDEMSGFNYQKEKPDLPLSRMTGFKPAAARVRAANKPEGPDPTMTTLGVWGSGVGSSVWVDGEGVSGCVEIGRKRKLLDIGEDV